MRWLVCPLKITVQDLVLQRGHHTYRMNWANSTGCMLCQGLQSLFTQQLCSANIEMGSGGTLFLMNSLYKALPPPESERERAKLYGGSAHLS